MSTPTPTQRAVAAATSGTFSCPWRHPDCVAGPGPLHHFHVPVWEALATPGTPEHYLLHAPLQDNRAFLALARLEPRSAAVRARVLDMVRYGPAQRVADAPDVTGEEWLTAALSGRDLDSSDVERCAGLLGQFCRTSPEDVLTAVLAHPACTVAALAAALDSAQWFPLRERALRDRTVAALETAGYPAVLAHAVATKYRNSGLMPGTVLTQLVARPDTCPVLERIQAGFTGTYAQLLTVTCDLTGPALPSGERRTRRHRDR